MGASDAVGLNIQERERPMRLVLKVIEGPESGHQFEGAGDSPILVGRAEHAHFRFQEDDRSISREHCLLELHPSSCFLIDLGSRNRTEVNDTKVTRAELRNGDVIRLGKTTLQVILSEEQEITNHCLDCQCDVSERANADGRAAELQGIALYLCEDCAARPDRRTVMDSQIGAHRLLAPLGAGGMGEVFSAWHELTGRLVALKKMLPIADERAEKWFEREMAIMKDLNHPSLVRWFDSGSQDGQHYFVAEFMLDGNLQQWVTKKFRGPLPPRTAIEYVMPMLEALEYAHRQGFVHRDIKLGNILFTHVPGGQEPLVKIGDFGLARSFLEVGGSNLTKLGEYRGTSIFMAPEQILNFRFVGPSVDVYAIGMILYYLLSRTYPMEKSVAMVDRDERIPLREKNPQITKKLAEIIDKSVKRKMEFRFQTAEQLKHALQRVVPLLEEDEIPTDPITT